MVLPALEGGKPEPNETKHLFCGALRPGCVALANTASDSFEPAERNKMTEVLLRFGGDEGGRWEARRGNC
jgi:hypothetical protein